MRVNKKKANITEQSNKSNFEVDKDNQDEVLIQNWEDKDDSKVVRQ